MFIFEFIKKFWKKTYITPKENSEDACMPDYDVSEEASPFIESYEDCEHVFMPIDSTGKTLACTKCGILVKKEDVCKENFFERKEI